MTNNDSVVLLKDAWGRLNDIKRHEDGRGMPFTLTMVFIRGELVVSAAELARVERELELFHELTPEECSKPTSITFF